MFVFLIRFTVCVWAQLCCIYYSRHLPSLLQKQEHGGRIVADGGTSGTFIVKHIYFFSGLRVRLRHFFSPDSDIRSKFVLRMEDHGHGLLRSKNWKKFIRNANSSAFGLSADGAESARIDCIVAIENTISKNLHKLCWTIFSLSCHSQAEYRAQNCTDSIIHIEFCCCTYEAVFSSEFRCGSWCVKENSIPFKQSRWSSFFSSFQEGITQQQVFFFLTNGTALGLHAIWSIGLADGGNSDVKSSTEVSQKDKIKTILQEYGKVAILSHSTIWALSLAVTYAGFRTMDMHSLISMLPERYRNRP